MNRNNSRHASTQGKRGHKLWGFIRKNAFTIVMGLFVVLMIASPDAKSWVLRQLMLTGVFNANIEENDAAATDASALNFDFKDVDGVIRNTSSLRGKVVFINFWASWCPPCRAEFPSIEKLYKAFEANPDIFFLMINEDSDLSAAHDYLKKGEYSIPFYRINGGVPREIYTGTLPTTVVLDKTGKMRLQHEGFANYGSAKFMKELEELTNE